MGRCLAPFLPALVALSIGPAKLVWVIVATLVIHQTENYLLAPRIMRKAVGVNPFVSLLAFFAFGSLLGLGGMLMAIPMAAIIQLLLDRFVFHKAQWSRRTRPGATLPAGCVMKRRSWPKACANRRGSRKAARLKGSSRWTRLLDEIEAITTDLDALLAQVHTPGAP